MSRRPREWTDDVLARMRKAVEDGLNLEAVALRFATGRRVVVGLIEKYGWRCPHAERSEPKPKKALPATQRFNLSKLDRNTRDEIADGDKRRYGHLLEDVEFLRRRGWPIHKERGGFRYGNELVDGARIASAAARERRLAGIA